MVNLFYEINTVDMHRSVCPCDKRLPKILQKETLVDHINVKRTFYCAKCWIGEKFAAINLLFSLLFVSSKILY